MKILLINQEHAHFSGPGGAERSVQSIAEYFASVGHQVTFLAMSRKTYHKNMNENGIHSVRMINGVKTILLGKISRKYTHAEIILPVVLSENPDVIHTNVFHKAPQLWEALSPLGIPMIHSLREYKLMCDNNMFDGVRDCGDPCEKCSISFGYAREMSQKLEGIVGISRFTLQRHLDNGFASKASVKRLIPNSYRPKSLPLPKHPRLEGMPPRFGFLGRMHASKGINLIIDAFSEIDPSIASITMAGDLQDEQITSRVNQLSQTHDARYIGFVNPAEFFRTIDVLIAPSVWHEPFGRITIEAFAHGIPVITTNRGGLPDIVTDGKTGWVFDADNYLELKKIVEEIYALPPKKLEAYTDRCKEAHLSYLPEKIGEMYLEAYREVIENKSKKIPISTHRVREIYHRNAVNNKIETALKSNLAPRESRPLKIAIVAGEFPKLSETFVLNHITGLLDLGHDVRILHTYPGKPDQVPYDYADRQLWKRTFSILPDELNSWMVKHQAKYAHNTANRIERQLETIGELGASGDLLIDAKKELKKFEGKLRDYYAAQIINEHFSDIDIVHVHFGHRPKQIYKYIDMRAFKAPMVCSFHGIDMSAHIQSFGPSLYDDIKHRLNKALPISNFFRQRLIGLGFDPKDVQVHRVGIDCAKFAFGSRVREEGGVLKLVSVGRLVEKKGFEYGIRAVRYALDMRPDVKIEYLIAGEGDVGDDLRKLVAELNLDDSVKLLGAQPHHIVTKLLAEGHAMVVPSVTGENGDMEGIPTVTMEAMATGLPVLSTFHSGIPEAVVDGYTGLLAPERDAEALAKLMIHLYDNPPLGEQLGRQGRAHVLLEFNIDRQNVKAEALYKRIVGGEED